MEINYIEFSNTGQIKINYEKAHDKLHVVSEEQAIPGFYTAFADLKDVLIEILKKPSLESSLGVRSIKFTTNEAGNRYCLIKGYFVNKIQNRKDIDVIKIETPEILIEDKHADKNKDFGLSKNSQDIIVNLIKEACLFVKGHRAQQEMFDRKTINKIENVVDEEDEIPEQEEK